MPHLGRFWRTVRPLKLGQLIGRLQFRLARPRPDLSSPPSLRTLNSEWLVPACRPPSISGAGTFVLLNEKGDLAEHSWDDKSKSLLWRYNQHYFDDLNAHGAAERRHWHVELIERWIADNPPPKGSGWEPYPTSLRIVNWVKYALGGNGLSETARHSLAIQARWLSKRLEWHLLGNHLFANAKALVFAGLFFSSKEAEGWLRTGVEILRKQVPEQILADGAQFELSPMYHALALEDALDLINVMRSFGCEELITQLEACMPRMLQWLLAMSHPDGELAFFNDTAMGIAPNNNELLRYAQDLGFNVRPPATGITHYEQSGYLRMELGMAVAITDLARVGPDYLPGHAHADTLSFELSVGGRRLVVNSGTSVYGTGPERQRQRGTAAHSTLVLDGKDSSEVWSGFRVGRRAEPFDVAAWESETSLIAHGAHNGFAHLPGRPVHRRKWTLSEGQLLVEDTVEGSGAHQIEAYFHLGPGISAVVDTTNGAVDLRDIEGGRQAIFSAEGGLVEVMPSSWHPEFGKRIDTTAIRVSAHRSLPYALRCELAWSAQ